MGGFRIYLLAAALLAPGASLITNPSSCRDARAALQICRTLGATVDMGPDGWRVRGRQVQGPSSGVLRCGESALCLRLFAPIAAALDLSPGQLHRPLGQLVSYGLLTRPAFPPEEGIEGGTRYQVSHALVHTYARERMQPDAETWQRLAGYYTALAETESEKGLPGYRRLDGERAHLMRVLTGWRIDLATWGKMFYLGVPSSIQGLTRNLAYLMLLAILNSTDAGARAVAGYTICGQIQMVGLMVGLAFMSAAMTAMSQNMGARDVARAERSCWTVVKISTISVAALAAAFIATGPWLIGFFTTDQEAMHWGRVSLNILSAVLPFMAIGMAFSGALRGAGDTMSPLYTSLLCTSGIGPGLAWLFTVVLGAGPTGAWWGLAVGIILQALLLTWIFRRGRWRDIRI